MIRQSLGNVSHERRLRVGQRSGNKNKLTFGVHLQNLIHHALYVTDILFTAHLECAVIHTVSDYEQIKLIVFKKICNIFVRPGCIHTTGRTVNYIYLCVVFCSESFCGKIDKLRKERRKIYSFESAAVTARGNTVTKKCNCNLFTIFEFIFNLRKLLGI